MAYLVYFYDTRKKFYFHRRYLYYTKAEIRAKAKSEFPGCRITSIMDMGGFY